MKHYYPKRRSSDLEGLLRSCAFRWRIIEAAGGQAAEAPREVCRPGGDMRFELFPIASEQGAAGFLKAWAVAGQWGHDPIKRVAGWRSEEHTSELQSLMRISYAVF